MRLSTFTSRVSDVVLDVVLALQRFDGSLDHVHRGRARIERHALGLLHAIVLQDDVLLRQDLAAFLQRDLGFLTLEALLMEADLRGQARIGQRARRDNDVAQLDVFRGFLAAEADGVNRNALAAEFGDGFEVHAAGIVGAVARQNHRADGEAGGIGHHLFQALADVRRGRRRGELLESFRSDPDGPSDDKDVLEIYPLKN